MMVFHQPVSTLMFRDEEEAEGSVSVLSCPLLAEHV